MNRKKISVICFGSALAGGIVNLLSPGNYIRHAQHAEGYNIMAALIEAKDVALGRVSQMFSSTLMPVVLILLIVYLLYLPIRVKVFKYLHPAVVACGFLISLIVIAFPVLLGYGGGYFPPRCYFIQDSATYLFSVCLAFYIAGWVKRRNQELVLQKEHIIVICMIAFMIFCGYYLTRGINMVFPSLGLADQICSGEMGEFRDYWEDVLEEIENGDDNVVISRKPLETDVPLLGPGIGDDEANWINQCVAWCYGKTTVKIIWEPEETE